VNRKTQLRRRTPLHARPRDTGPKLKTRLMVYNRDDWRCACCGQNVMGRPHSVGHRVRRSQGGKNTLPNLLTFLGPGRNPLDPDDHHARIDSRRDPHDEARGYTCRSWEDPARIPVMYFSEDGSGIAAWLLPDGTLSVHDPERAA
jgi:5-methylcytosine-specific restriction endonuclease McrA